MILAVASVGQGCNQMNTPMSSIQQETPSYPNPTIIEAVAEVYFDRSLSTDELESLQCHFQESYRCDKERLVSINTSIGPSGINSNLVETQDFRIKVNICKSGLLQIYKERLSFHWLNKYPGWPVFKQQLQSLIEQFQNQISVSRATQIGVRFINKVDRKSRSQQVGRWLKGSRYYPMDLLQAKRDYFYRGRWPTGESSLLQICIAEDCKAVGNCYPLLLDIDIVRSYSQPVDLSQDLAEVIDRSHQEVYLIFDSATSAHYKKLLNEERP